MPYQQAQNYYYQFPQYQNRASLLGLKGRPVSSIEEVRAAAIDFDGSISYFPDIANGKIYTKQCNIDGTASLNMYELKETPPISTAPDYVTREEFNTTLNNLMAQANLVGKSTDQTQKPQTSNPEFKFR